MCYNFSLGILLKTSLSGSDKDSNSMAGKKHVKIDSSTLEYHKKNML